MGHRKDRSPEDTIHRARAILAGLGLFFRETSWRNFTDQCYAVTIEADVGDHLASSWSFTSNGKGQTPELALASAYAEILERIQNLCCPGAMPLEYGRMPERLTYPDEVPLTLDNMVNDQPDLMPHLFSRHEMQRFGNRRFSCHPFCKVSDGKIAHLPSEVLYWRCMSNGMCAGNTPEEAIIQGICEVFERYVARQLFLHDAALPIVDRRRVLNEENRLLVEEIERLDYRVAFRDCSLGGRFPVMGVLFIDPHQGVYHFHLGSDPQLDIAVQRCLTETVQTLQEPIRRGNALGRTMKPMIWEDEECSARTTGVSLGSRLGDLYLFFRRSRSRYPSSLLIKADKAMHTSAFIRGTASNSSALNWLLDRLSMENAELYVRDVSFLGFPSFRAYIPGMSEVFEPSNDEGVLELAFESVPQVRETVLDLANASRDDIRLCAQHIEKIISHPRFPPEELSVRWHVNYHPHCEFAQFKDVDLLLAMLHQRLGDSRKAYASLARFLTSMGETRALSSCENADYFWCLLGCMRLNWLGVPEETGQQVLGGLFGELLAQAVHQEIGRPEKAFQDTSLPTCGDCDNCGVREDCRYPQWLSITGKLRSKMLAANWGQEHLAIDSSHRGVLSKT